VAGVLARGTSRGERTGAPKPPPDELPPRRFGDYELLKLIARGGMGLVYRARQASLNRFVALKVIRGGQFAGPDEVRRFRLEAGAAARLEHPHIVPIHEIGEHDGRHYFAMKLAEGGSLAAKCEGRGKKGEPLNPLAPRPSALLLLKVARAVHFAHERGILHRDLKPANILLDAAGEPMVSDFGLAKLAQSDHAFTLDGATLGTPAYMSPEQAAGRAAQVTTASDVYSLGAILYHLLAGRPPFEADTPLETMRQVVEEEPVPPSKCELRGAGGGPKPRLVLRPSRLASDLETICLKCLEKNPAARYASAAALADDLEHWLRGEPIAARPASAAERALKWVRRKPAQAALLAVCAVGAGAFAALLLAGDARLRRERNVAQAHAQRAEAAFARAETERRRAETNEFTARLHLYAADISLALRALDDGNLGLARRTLDAHLPPPPNAASPPVTDLRGFEWHHLRALSRGQEALVLRRHSRPVTALAFPRDGASIASAGRDGQICFWSVASGALDRALPQADTPRGFAENPLLTSVFAASPEVLALLATGAETFDALKMRSRPATPGDLRAAAWSPDGQWLATGGDGSYVRVWSVTNQALVFVLPAQSTRALAFTPDSAHLVVAEAGLAPAGGAGEVRVYDMGMHHRIRTVPGVQPCFALAPDGATLAVARLDGTVELQDFATGERQRAWRAGSVPKSLAFSPDGRLLAALDPHRSEVVLWNAGTGEPRGRLSAGREPVWAMAFAPDNQTLATAGSDHAVRLWDLGSLRERGRLHGHEDEVLAVAFAPAGDALATAGKDHSVRLWRLDAVPNRDEQREERREPVCVAPDGRAFLARSAEGALRCQELSRPNAVELPAGEKRTALGFSADGRSFATLRRAPDNDAALAEVWTLSGERLGAPTTLRGAPEGWRVAAGAFAADRCALGGERETVTVHSIRTGELRRRLRLPRRHLNQLVLSPDGRRLAAFSWPRQLLVADVATGEVRGWWPAAEGAIQVLAFTPDGHLLATAGDDNVISVWDASTGKRAAVLRGHKAEVKALAFSADGRTLASSGADLALKLWHVPTWRELGALRRDGLFTFLAFTAGGRGLLAHEYRRALHVLRAAAE
jgi:WD40 repeat protein